MANTNLNRLASNVFFTATCGASNYRGNDVVPDFVNNSEQGGGNNTGNNGGGNNGNNGHGGGKGNKGPGGDFISVDPSSPTASLKTSSTPGQLKISPNPTSDFAKVDITFSKVIQNAGYQIVDLSGQVIFEMENPINGLVFSEKINVSSLPAGTYLLNVIDEGGSLLQFEKIVVVK